MKTKEKNGISLIVLVITILVMIILAGVVIVSLQESNPINKAKEANFKSDVSNFASELGLGMSNELALNIGTTSTDVVAVKGEQVKKYVNSFSKKYENKIIIIDGKLGYLKDGSKEEKWAEEAGLEIFKSPNKPALSEGMIPIKFNGTNWVICKEDDPKWYNYEKELWANVMLSDGKYIYKDGKLTKRDNTAITKEELSNGINDEDLGSMFVWIPRFAYSIKEYKTDKYINTEEGSVQEIHDITFLLGGSNCDIEGKRYAKTYDTTKCKKNEATPKIVHPAFNFGGKEVTGIWVAKFEASKNVENVKIGPGKETWNYIDRHSMLKKCLEIKDKKSIYGISSIDSHLMKNTEWGAVAYFTTSKYGSTPKISNKFTNIAHNNYKIYTGGENYRINVDQSTTGNITGIYDMNGGGCEAVAGYIATSSNLGNNLVFNNNTIKPEYEKYYDKYIDGFCGNKENNVKGDAVYEIIDDTKIPIKTDGLTLYNNDMLEDMINPNDDPFIYRGGDCKRSDQQAKPLEVGIFCINCGSPNKHRFKTFRPTLVALN